MILSRPEWDALHYAFRLRECDEGYLASCRMYRLSTFRKLHEKGLVKLHHDFLSEPNTGREVLRHYIELTPKGIEVHGQLDNLEWAHAW